jgi:putative transposase
MARKPRYNIVGVPQHVIQRGNNREPCFFAEADYCYYLDCLAGSAEKYGCDVHAYVLMTNHVHLLVTPNRQNAIPQMMQSLGRKYVRYVNHVYKRTGTLWEGRYKSSLVDESHYLLTCMRYIELNPVRAGMVEVPGEYRWSSYRANGYGEADECIKPHLIYRSLGDGPEIRMHQYRLLFSTALEDAQVHEIRETLNQELVLGKGYFKDRIETMLGRRVRPGQVGRPRVEEEAGIYCVY